MQPQGHTTLQQCSTTMAPAAANTPSTTPLLKVPPKLLQLLQSLPSPLLLWLLQVHPLPLPLPWFPPAQAPLQVQPSLLLNHPIPSLACYNTLQNKPATKSTEASQPTPALAPNPKLKDPITTKTRSTMICSFPSSYETTWRQQLFNASVSWISSNSSTLSMR